MKIKLFLLTLLTLAIAPTLALAQGGDAPTVSGLVESFVSLTAVAGLVAAVTEFFANAFKIPEGAEVKLLWFKLKTVQFVSFFVGIAMGLFGFFFSLGIFIDVLWWQAALVGFGSAFIANGIATTGLIKQILHFIGIYLRQKKTA